MKGALQLIARFYVDPPLEKSYAGRRSFLFAPSIDDWTQRKLGHTVLPTKTVSIRQVHNDFKDAHKKAED